MARTVLIPNAEPVSVHYRGHRTAREEAEAQARLRQFEVDNGILRNQLAPPPRVSRRGTAAGTLQKYSRQDAKCQKLQALRRTGLRRHSSVNRHMTARGVRQMVRNLVRPSQTGVLEMESPYGEDDDDPFKPMGATQPPPGLIRDIWGHVMEVGDGIEVINGKHKKKMGYVTRITPKGYVCVALLRERPPWPLDNPSLLIGNPDSPFGSVQHPVGYDLSNWRRVERAYRMWKNEPLRREVQAKMFAETETNGDFKFSGGPHHRFRALASNVLYGSFVHELTPRARRLREFRLCPTYSVLTELFPASYAADLIAEFLAFEDDGDTLIV